MRQRQGVPERNPPSQTTTARFRAVVAVYPQAIEYTQKTSAGVAQTGRDTGHGHQQRLFQRAVLGSLLLTGTCQQLGLQ